MLQSRAKHSAALYLLALLIRQRHIARRCASYIDNVYIFKALFL